MKSLFKIAERPSYYESKKLNGLILTQRHLDPGKPLTALDDNENVITGSDGLPQWDREKGRYRTYEEQQEFAKKNNTSATLPPNNKRALNELEKLIAKYAASAADLTLPNNSAA